MHFTREPIIESIITPRNGYKLLLTSNKNDSQEPMLLDFLELVSFGFVCFFRGTHKSKMFLLPISDYEIVETRDARMNLRVPGLEKGIKIAGGRGMPLKAVKEVKEEKMVVAPSVESVSELVELSPVTSKEKEVREDEKESKWKEKKRYKKRKEATEQNSEEKSLENVGSINSSETPSATSKLFALLPPPSMLISEVIRQQDKERNVQKKKDAGENNHDAKDQED